MRGMKNRRYPTDLSDAQWELLGPLLEKPKHHGGAPRKHTLREITNGMLYVLRGGISWRMMPTDLPPWESVYDHFRRWKKDGTIAHVHDLLREQVREKEGRQKSPSAAILDSQSVRTAEKGGSVATIKASRSRDASATSPSTHLACCSASSSTRPASPSRPEGGWSWRS
jgi:transposase